MKLLEVTDYRISVIEKSYRISRLLSKRLRGRSIFLWDRISWTDGYSFRWHPSLPGGIPHLTTEDDVYNGMFIPKGSLVMANAR